MQCYHQPPFNGGAGWGKAEAITPQPLKFLPRFDICARKCKFHGVCVKWLEN